MPSLALKVAVTSISVSTPKPCAAKASRTTLSARSIGRLSEVSMQSMFVPFS